MKVLFALLALAAQSRNPEYDGWADCKTGSWVKLRMEIVGPKFVVDFTWTLLELTKEKAVVERKSSAKGQADSTDKEEVPSAEDKHPVTIEAQGEEEIEVAGKKLKCRWIEGSQGQSIKKTKQWISKEVPGGLVKVELTSADGTAMKMIATGWEKK